MTQIGLRIGDIKGATGSAYCELNGSKVFAAVYGPIEPENQQVTNTAIVECAVENAWNSKENLENIQHKLLHTFSSTICLSSYSKTLIRIAITIISPGALLSDAATLAGSLALLDAGIEMVDFVVSCTVGWIDNKFQQFQSSNYCVRVAIEEAIAGCKQLHQTVHQFISSNLTKQ